uniref:helix-turn-helix domain-containing protein n=1 Tax=Pseudonocardia autotrophica TaxID=2074 RepID=UPI0013029B47
MSYKDIALAVGRDRSVISREVRRHGGREVYRAAAAAQEAQAARARPKRLAVSRDRHAESDGSASIVITTNDSCTCAY